MDSDQERRKRLASLPFSEKLQILEKLRDRSRVIAASDLRKFAIRRQGREGDLESASVDQINAPHIRTKKAAARVFRTEEWVRRRERAGFCKSDLTRPADSNSWR
jgi:hypothetical protein